MALPSWKFSESFGLRRIPPNTLGRGCGRTDLRPPPPDQREPRQLPHYTQVATPTGSAALVIPIRPVCTLRSPEVDGWNRNALAKFAVPGKNIEKINDQRWTRVA